jgi:polyferredoxin
VYSGVLLLLLTSMVTTIALRKPAILDVMRDRNALYRDVGRKGIENSYTLRVINKQNEAHAFTLSVTGMEGISINTQTEIFLQGESVMTLPVSVTAPHESAVGGNIISFELRSTDGSNIYVTEESRFRGPAETR